MNRMLSPEELKKCELDILKDVARFCDEHEIHYSLTFGTLLGAIRHKGFIPWDDDIDIAVPRDEYEYLIKNYTHDRYKMVEMHLQEDYPYAFAKVIDTCTELKEQSTSSFPMGVYIDIFPVDGLPETDQERHMKTCQNACRTALYKLVSLKYPTDLKHRLIHIAVKIFLLPFSQRKIISKQHDLATRYSIEQASEVSILTIRLGCKRKFSKGMFYNIVKHPFEDAMFNIPAAYEQYLTAVYGDYMTPPPEDKRIAHFLEAYWKEQNE